MSSSSKIRSVCKHCLKKIELIEMSELNYWLHVGSGQKCESTLAEPASTVEPELKLRCVSELPLSTGGKIRCEKSPDHKHDHYGYLPDGKLVQWVQWPARPSEPSAPHKMIDVGGKEHNETTQCKYSDCKPAPHAKNCVCIPCLDKSVKKDLKNIAASQTSAIIGKGYIELDQMIENLAAPQPVSGDAPKVEEIASTIQQLIEEAKLQHNRNHTVNCICDRARRLIELLRPYFLKDKE